MVVGDTRACPGADWLVVEGVLGYCEGAGARPWRMPRHGTRLGYLQDLHASTNVPYCIGVARTRLCAMHASVP